MGPTIRIYAASVGIWFHAGGTTPTCRRYVWMKVAPIRNGRQAMLVVLIVAEVIEALIYAASILGTEPDGSVDPEASVINPD